MNKTEFAAIVADKVDLTKRDAEKVINAVFETITEALLDGEKIVFSGFGSFELHEKPERIGRNPQTGEEITIPASTSVSFKVGKILKDTLNQD